MVASPDSFEVRLPSDEELQLFYGGDEDEDDEGVDNDPDSNDENYYKNDYPDEDEFKNESTTDDDDYGRLFDIQKLILRQSHCQVHINMINLLILIFFIVKF